MQLVAKKKHYTTMVLMFDKLLIFTVSTDDISKNGIWFKMALKSGIHSIIKRNPRVPIHAHVYVHSQLAIVVDTVCQSALERVRQCVTPTTGTHKLWNVIRLKPIITLLTPTYHA